MRLAQEQTLVLARQHVRVLHSHELDLVESRERPRNLMIREASRSPPGKLNRRPLEDVRIQPRVNRGEEMLRSLVCGRDGRIDRHPEWDLLGESLQLSMGRLELLHPQRVPIFVIPTFP